MPFTSSATETSNEEVLPQDCDPQADKNQKDIEEFLNSFMTNPSCKETNGLVICAADNRPAVSLAAPESLGEEILLTSEQESDLQSRLARLSEIFDLSVDEPLAITKDNKVYQIDSSNNVVTEIDLTTQQRKDVALDPNLLVAGFGGSGRLEILNEKGQSDFVDFNELFNAGSESSESKDQESSDEEPSNEEISNEETAGSSKQNEMALGMIDPSTTSYSTKEEKNEKLLSQLEALHKKLAQILKQIKNEQPQNSDENPTLLLEKPSENLPENLFGNLFENLFANRGTSALLKSPSRGTRFSQRTRFGNPNFNRANSANENRSLVSGAPSSISTANPTREKAFGEGLGNPSNPNVVSSSNTFDSSAAAPIDSPDLNSKIADQTENLAVEIFDPREKPAMAANPWDAESNNENPKQSHVLELASLIGASLVEALNLKAWNRIPEISGFMDLINPSPLNSANREKSSNLAQSDRASHETGTSDNTPQQAEPKLLATLNDRRKLLAEPPAKNLA